MYKCPHNPSSSMVRARPIGGACLSGYRHVLVAEFSGRRDPSPSPSPKERGGEGESFEEEKVQGMPRNAYTRARILRHGRMPADTQDREDAASAGTAAGGNKRRAPLVAAVTRAPTHGSLFQAAAAHRALHRGFHLPP